jgi:hypothetical protein
MKQPLISLVFGVVFAIGVAVAITVAYNNRSKPFERVVRRYPCTDEQMLEVLVKSGNSFPAYERSCLDNIVTY